MPGDPIRPEFGGLSNTRIPRAVGLNQAFNSLNCTTERGALEAREGILQRWKRPSDPSEPAETDRGWGTGVGRYEGRTVVLHFIKPDGQTKCRLYVEDKTSLTTRTFDVAPWNNRDDSAWEIVQSGEYLYCANETDGLYRYKISDLTSAAFEQAPVYLTSIVRAPAEIDAKDPRFTELSWSGFTPKETAGTPFQEPANSVAFDSTSINAQGQFEGTNTNDIGSPQLTNWHFAGTYASNQDWTEHRYIVATVELEETSDYRKQEDPGFPANLSGSAYQFRFRWTSSSSPTYGGTWSGWYEADCHVYYTGYSTRDGGKPTKAMVVVDMDSSLKRSSSAPVDQVRSICFSAPVWCGNQAKGWLNTLQLGGTWLARPDNSYLLKTDSSTLAEGEDVEYAVTFYDTGTLEESSATFKTLSKYDAAGDALTSLIPAGMTAVISLPAPDVGFDRTRLYRRRHSDGDQWYLIEEVAAATDAEDSRVDWIDDPLDWAETAIKASNYEFGTGLRQDLAPQCIAVWKTHMVLGVGAEAYLSKAQDPANYAQPLRNTSKTGEVDTDNQEIAPRTLYVAADRAEKVKKFISGDILYAGTERGTYAMIGDAAALATPFRKIPNSRGPLDRQSMCAFKGGVLIACKEGLFFYQASRALAESDASGTYAEELLTGDIHESWKWLINSSNAPLIVGAYEDQIFVIRGRFVLVRRRAGKWERWALSSQSLGSGTDGVNTDDPGTEDDDTDVFDDPDDGGTEDPGDGGDGDHDGGDTVDTDGDDTYDEDLPHEDVPGTYSFTLTHKANWPDGSLHGTSDTEVPSTPINFSIDKANLGAIAPDGLTGFASHRAILNVTCSDPTFLGTVELWGFFTATIDMYFDEDQCNERMSTFHPGYSLQNGLQVTYNNQTGVTYKTPTTTKTRVGSGHYRIVHKIPFVFSTIVADYITNDFEILGSLQDWAGVYPGSQKWYFPEFDEFADTVFVCKCEFGYTRMIIS